MKHLIITGLLSLLVYGTIYSQTQKVVDESPSLYFNNFQKFTNDEFNVDSAFYYVKKLALNKRFEPLLKDLLHNSFAQAFVKRNVEGESDVNKNIINKRILLSKELLRKIETDTTYLLKEVSKPIISWTKIQDNQNNIPLLTNLTNEFILQNLTPSKFYSNKSGRYGLLIYKIINQQAELKSLSLKIFNSIKDDLRVNQIAVTEKSTRAELDKRAWYRYLYGFVNNYESSLTNDLSKQEILLKTAFDYSPDLTDKNHQPAYFYDMIFLDGKESFEDDYLAFIVKNTSDKNQVIQTLLKMALTEPNHKEKLKDFYTKNNSTSTNFTNFWVESIENKAETAPMILINQIDKKQFSSKELYGKWILIDFWGTWCSPCREEHPDLQKFYDQFILHNSNKIALLTIACNDIEDKVVKYMNEKKYFFPVAMSNGSFETNFKVQGYPTKILVTPKGKYITVPFNIDWTNFIKKYIDL